MCLLHLVRIPHVHKGKTSSYFGTKLSFKRVCLFMVGYEYENGCYLLKERVYFSKFAFYFGRMLHTYKLTGTLRTQKMWAKCEAVNCDNTR